MSAPQDPQELLARLIDAERGVTPDAAVRAANWAAVRGRLAASAGATGATSGALGKLLGTALVVATGATIVVAARDPGPPEQPATEQRPASVIVREAADEPRPAPEPPPPPIVPDVPKDSGWDAELRVLQQVQAALRAGQSEQALALVDEYRRRWPQGVFIEEIAAAQALGVCAGSDRRAARRALAAFNRAWPRSLYAARVRQGCTETPARE